MKKLYPAYILFLALQLLAANRSVAQCTGGVPSGITAYDTTIAFATGVTNQQIKFPKFDPEDAMLTCVRLVVTITGIIDTVAMQNYSASPQTASFSYNRTDQMTGPGLSPALSNSTNLTYGPYNLTGYDGVPGSGTDFRAIPRDTVLNQVMTRTLTDSIAISTFYGEDSVTYDYNISVLTSASITGGSSSSLVLTSALVRYRLEYCTCPASVLPLGLKNFTVAKTAADAVALRWQAETDNDAYAYEVEVSRDGQHFTKAATVQKQYNTFRPAYVHPYYVRNDGYGRYYFRIKQVWANGYHRYTDIKPVDFTNPLFAGVRLYPNPSPGTVGLKFVNAKAGRYWVHVSNATGQVVAKKELVITETDYKTVAVLGAGMYWVKLTDAETGASYVSQVAVK